MCPSFYTFFFIRQMFPVVLFLFLLSFFSYIFGVLWIDWKWWWRKNQLSLKQNIYVLNSSPHYHSAFSFILKHISIKYLCILVFKKACCLSFIKFKDIYLSSTSMYQVQRYIQTVQHSKMGFKICSAHVVTALR